MDLDNTLWDVFPALERAEANSYQLLELRYPRITQMFSKEAVLALRSQIYEARPDIRSNITLVRTLVFAELLRAAGYRESDADYLMQKFSVDRNRVEFYPDAMPALQVLAANYPIVALSDGNADLRQIGIDDLFTASVFAADVGHMKPHPDGFIKACELAGASPAATLHIGDHPEYDIAGARNAGLQTMWIRRNGELWDLPFEPDYKIKSLAEAAAILC